MQAGIVEQRHLYRGIGRKRRVQQARPSTDGRFSFVNLPPGAYLLEAVIDVTADAWRTTEFLAAVAPAGVKVTLEEGGKITQDLRIGGR